MKHAQRIRRMLGGLVVSGLLASCGATGAAGPARPSTTASTVVPTSARAVTSAATVPDILAAPTRIARTHDGTVGYREVGSGSPLLLVTGFGASMDDWAPTFVDGLAAHHEVIVFDNAGVGLTAAPVVSSIPAMAEQTSALLSALGIRRTAVLGWSMGGMIAQALAVEHPAQVSRLILAATQAGNGRALPVPAAAAAALASSNPLEVLSVLFPPDQFQAAQAYAGAIVQYPDFYQASGAVKASQNVAIDQWFAGSDPQGRLVDRLRVPTLVADGTLDRLDPVANDVQLARLVRGSSLVLYRDAGHAFLFQDASRFIPLVDRLLR